MPSLSAPRYRGIYPVVPTTFHEDGTLDLASQKRCLDFMIDSGVDGLCILANYSEQFLLGDDEREILTRTTLEHVAGRVPVIVTTTHTSTAICATRSRHAQDMGAAMVMVMPPYHGATFRFSETQVRVFFQGVSDAIGIPIMVQDAPAAGTPLSPAFLARMAQEIEQVSYFKMETAGAANKLRELIALGGEAIEVVSASHTLDQTHKFALLAARMELLASAGSDFHAPGEGGRDVGLTQDLPPVCVPVWSRFTPPRATPVAAN